MKAHAAGRQPAQCLITYCLLSIIVSLWEMAIDSCVFVSMAISFQSHIHTFQGIQAQRLGENLCATQKVSRKPSKGVDYVATGMSRWHIKDLFWCDCFRGHACAAVCRAQRLHNSQHCGSPSVPFLPTAAPSRTLFSTSHTGRSPGKGRGCGPKTGFGHPPSPHSFSLWFHCFTPLHLLKRLVSHSLLIVWSF